VPAVYGPLPVEARNALRETAKSIGATSITLATDLYAPSNVRITLEGTEFDLTHRGQTVTMKTGLIGLPQATNVSVAMAMLESAGAEYNTSLEEAREVLPSVRLPGRFERRGKFIFDVAHNPDGMAALVRTLDSIGPARPLVVVLGVLRDKDWQGIMRAICPIGDSTIVTSPPSAPKARAWNPEEAVAFGISNGWKVTAIPDLSDALSSASNIGETVVVTGSFHTVGDASLLVPDG
jgi:dihydrofolate synthase/folylpolyglutamate synthase